MRPKCSVPKPYHHKPTDQDAVVLRDSDGKRRTVYLGKHGSAAAADRYRKVLADHLEGRPVATATAARVPPPSRWPTVARLCAAFLLHAQRYYAGPGGKPSREVENLRHALRTLLELHRDTPTDRFGICELQAVRQAMVDSGRLCRNVVNGRVRRIKSVFRWGTEQKLVSGETWHELSALRGLTRGRCGARETGKVEAVPWKLVEATLPHLVPTVHDLVLLQWWSGMRPTEVLELTRRQLDISGPTWFYRVEEHKGAWRGRERIIALGPKAQAILRPRLRLEQDAPLFSGRDAWNERRVAMRAARTCEETKQTRDRDRRAKAHAATIAEQMDVHEYRRHIHRAADKAGVPHWSPHRLRHAAGTRLVKEAGLEAARAALGHADERMTRRYSHGADVAIAADVAARLG